ncbi:6-carboxy-5,6,7,8-tetrahydropterin synthase [Hondaea fermentalgiana]|uniref:6-pyruvoyltetrahydropterin synthase n=1 Tax=Hondaea fermentalgiana TaxID=2315210 RepID=A0A2R5FZR7_9STRA|nr:6-carboxy-5,6,7,8-tetrahydropterin synthase [Hondaea fermentalgiana]|eukprot:GBG24230.1 6-carboxy-5,6,7,8-tetrahydropterin synthase [Hondaea fermentalgiana]
MPFFEVHVAKEKFKFNCAHFIAFKGFRERLHGHNYQVGVKLSGDRGPDGYVLDFGEVKEQVMRICKLWNERFICPVKSDVLDIDLTSNEDNITINCEDGTHFSFPRDDCLFLPIVHSSAEELAEHFAVLLVSSVGAERLRSRGIRDIEVSVAEAPHQAAIYRCTIEHLLEIASGSAEATQTQVERPTPKPCTHTNCCKAVASDAQKQEQEQEQA